jgi:lysophospholipase L1-like esterase
MTHDANDNDDCSPDQTERFEREFQTWRRAWLESMIDDYGDLKRYRAANATLAPSAPDEERVVFFGDSITEGWALGEHFPGKPYINRGIGAQTTPQMLLRFRQDVVELGPKAVIIHAGINDIGGNTGPMPISDTQSNLASMMEIAEANGVRAMAASLLPPPHRGAALSRYNLLKHPAAKILEFNRWLEAYSASRGAVFLDYFSAMIDGDGFVRMSFSEDGLHPAPAGYRAMAQVVRTALRPSG